MATIHAEKPYSTHPDDGHLRIVLATSNKGEYVTWAFNKQDGGFFWGHYFGDDYDAALADFNKRPAH